MSAGRASIEDVAADAQVSITTVSHALSGRRAVSPATLRRVQASVERLNYRPNMAARSLRGQRSHTIALMVADITNPYYPAVARGVHDYLLPAGYLAFVCNTDGVEGVERMFLREMIARDVDGIIVEHLSLSVEEIRSIIGTDLPLVIMGPKRALMDVDRVCTDDAHGIRECVKFLSARGIDDVAFVSGPPGQGPGDIRAAAFSEAMMALGNAVSSDGISHSSYTRDGGARAVARILDSPRLPRAIMCANDLIAIGALDAARSRGLRVPQDLSIVGFDNIETAELVSPRLTTIDNPAGPVGLASAELLMRRISAGPQAPTQHVSLPTRLVVRDSA